MDPVTHTLVGAAVGGGFFKKHLGPAAIPALALASNLPDLDGIAMFFPMEAAVTLRRSFGHSLFLVPLWSLALAHVLRLRYKDQRLDALYWACLTGASLHLFFDLINSFGVLLLWPFSLWRPELASVFIIDLFLTSLLALPWLRRTERAFRAALAAAAFYLALCLAGRWQAQGLLAKARESQPTSFSYVFPEPFGPHRWRGVALSGHEYRLYLIHSLSGAVEERGAVPTAPEDDAVLKARSSPLGRRLLGFFKAPVWQVRPDGRIRAFDLRFCSLLLERDGVFEYTLAP
jgi:inner membrane protein